MERPNQAPALLVIADDLTGANDVGVQFAKGEIPSVVMTQPGTFPRGYEVVVVNTESRHVPPEAAAERVRNAATQGAAAGVRNFFKKTDSTLRGNIGAELEALLTATGEVSLAFVPAFPEMGRTTRDGIHYVEGIPIAESAFGSDPLSPIRDSAIVDVIRRTSKIAARSARLGADVNWDSGCLVLDCESRRELHEIAQWLAAKGRLRVAAGSAAFAEELPNVIELRREAAPKLELSEPILLVNGSLNPRALEQAAAAGVGYRRVQMKVAALLREGEAKSLVDEILSENERSVLLHSARDRDEYEMYRREAKKLGVSGSDLHKTVSNATGQIVRSLLERGNFGTLVVFGGDTLMGIARACDWSAIVPRTEVSAGITVATPLGSNLTVISKAGGFGTTDVMERISTWVRANSRLP